MLPAIVFILSGYLFGSISSAIVVSRIMGLPDPRTQGSGNPGATNILRMAGKQAAGVTLFGDLLKGLIPVLLARAFGASLEIQLLVAGAAFLGHLYPLFFGFKGGKGVATAVGVLFGLDWRVGLACLATWLVIYAWKKISSLAALVSAGVAPFYILLITGSGEFTLFGLLLSWLIFWRHRTNIRKLRMGTEA